VTDASKRQLAHLKEAHDLLKAAGIPHWLAGGWAIDFLVGRVTRQHSDVDFAIWKDDWLRVEALLLAHDFAPRANKFPDETGRLVHKGTHFEFYLLQKNTAGDIFVGGRWTDWPFPDQCWSATGCLQGLHVPVMSPNNLLDGKRRWPDQEHGSPLREKDQQDIDILRSYLAREM
jgi:Aminoglycoside-2''-adenylyltransferase